MNSEPSFSTNIPDPLPPGAAPQDTQRTARRHFSKLGLMYFLGSLIIFGVQLAVVQIIIRLPAIKIDNMDTSLFISTIPMYLIGMPLMILLIHTVPSVPISRHRMTFGQCLIAFLMCYAVMYLSNLVGVVITQVIGLFKGSSVNNILMDIVTEISPWTALFLMVLCAPVMEELIFRKLLIDRTVKYGEKVSVLFSALFFGLFHGNLNQFVYAFTLGAFFGFIYVKTGRIRYTIGLHMVVNFLGSVAGMFLLNLPVYKELTSFSGDTAAWMARLSGHLSELILICLYGLIIFGFLISGIICLAVNAKKMTLQPGEITLPKGKLFSAAFINIGVILFALFWIIQIIQQLLE